MLRTNCERIINLNINEMCVKMQHFSRKQMEVKTEIWKTEIWITPLVHVHQRFYFLWGSA